MSSGKVEDVTSAVSRMATEEEFQQFSAAATFVSATYPINLLPPAEKIPSLLP